VSAAEVLRCGPDVNRPPCAECVLGDDTPERLAFARRFDRVAPAWFVPTADQIGALFVVWSQFRDAEALVEKIRPDVERLAELVGAAWGGWSDLSMVLADPNELPGRWCDLVGELLAEIVGLENSREGELADLLNRAMDPPPAKTPRRTPLVTLTVEPEWLTDDHRVTLAAS
jgi:hypothetical protein